MVKKITDLADITWEDEDFCVTIYEGMDCNLQMEFGEPSELLEGYNGSPIKRTIQ